MRPDKILRKLGIFERRNGSIQRLELYPKILSMAWQVIEKNGKQLLGTSGQFVSGPIPHLLGFWEQTDLAALQVVGNKVTGHET